MEGAGRATTRNTRGLTFDRLDGAALAGGIAALEQDDDPELVGPDIVLEMAELDLELGQFLLIVLPLHPPVSLVLGHVCPFAA